MPDLSQVGLEQIRSWAKDTFPGELGVEPLEIGAESSRGRIVVERRHLHPGGFVHGGVWTALGDTVAAWTTYRSVPAHHDFTTIELKLNVFAAGLLGDQLLADARPLHVGRSTAAIEVRIERIREGSSKLAANLIVTQFVLPPS